ncbi:FadR/GntR family transcriptional regulator [Bacillus sp. Marseille-P3661]|uniref:FadR/GntR family transcriptional regulator n=1 Tax=Bacillus sp. Marseille-P3661 TaxID=1936234 RepID=UPI000C82CC07|nr:FadR/GntR family transcriptional regulator [Bacillus sp. Marseille-P3661]
MGNNSDIKINSVKRQTLSKQVIDEIIDLLLKRRFNPGDSLPSEMELMKMLGVSRPVIREALSSLETLGIITRKTREGSHFAKQIGSEPFSLMLALSAGNANAIMETRISIETGMVALAAEKISDDDLLKLEEVLKQFKNADDTTEADRQFHLIIASSASNPILLGFIDPLLEMFDKTIKLVSLEDRDRNETYKQHVAIYDALKNRDPEAAMAAMFQHLDFVRKRIIKTS